MEAATYLKFYRAGFLECVKILNPTVFQGGHPEISNPSLLVEDQGQFWQRRVDAPDISDQHLRPKGEVTESMFSKHKEDLTY